MTTNTQEIPHVKCKKCKCWRSREQFLNVNGRKLKTCNKCRKSVDTNTEKYLKATDIDKLTEGLLYLIDKEQILQLKLSVAYIKNETPTEIKYNNETRVMEIYFTALDSMMTLSKDRTWDNTKRYIDSIIKGTQDKTCSICEEEFSKSREVGCNRCSNRFCLECYISIFKANKGLIICPFCRFTHGREVPGHLVALGIKHMRASLNC